MTSTSNPTSGPAQLTAAQERELEKYRNDKILTAPPQVLISMLLERAMSDIDGAMAATIPQERSQLIRHAQDVVLELRCCLDLTQGQIAGNLDSLYDYVNRQCLDAFVSGTVEPLVPARTVIADIHAGWQALL